MPVFSRHNEAHQDPHLWSFPSSFRSISFKKHGTTLIPRPAIFRDAVDSKLSPSAKRSSLTPGHVAVHLCLLECVHKLKQHSSKLFTTTAEANRKSSTWNTLLRLSIDRFQVWYSKIGEVLRRTAFYHKTRPNPSDATFTQDYLPPLDVLYIWTVCLNNPNTYLPQYPELLFPWEAVLKCVDTEEFTYTISTAAQNLFRTITGQEADILEYLKSPPVYLENKDEDTVTRLWEAAQSHNALMEGMHSFLWIRSPGLEGTLYRGLVQYKQMEAISRKSRATIVLNNPLMYLISATSEISNPSSRYNPDVKDSTEVSYEASDEILSDCHCWVCERIRDEDPAYIPGASQLTLTKDQIQEIKDDIGFYKYVEQFRQTNPSGTPLPTRPLTRRDLEERDINQRKRDKAGVYYGLGYVVEEKRPAVYDNDGNLLKPAKLKVKRASETHGINWMIAGP